MKWQGVSQSGKEKNIFEERVNQRRFQIQLTWMSQKILHFIGFIRYVLNKRINSKLSILKFIIQLRVVNVKLL